jgi:hypothetical protein
MAMLTWPDRELPILEAVLHAQELGEDPNRAARLAVPELPANVYMETIASLHDDGFLDAAVSRGGGGLVAVRVRRLLPDGRRAVGQWPAADLADQLLAELRRRFEEEPDEARRSALGRLLEAAGGVSKEILTAILTRLAERATGLG